MPGLRALRRALTRLLGVPIGLSGSGPTLWALYPALAGAEEAAGRDPRGARGSGCSTAPGAGPPFVAATTIAAHATAQEEPGHDPSSHQHERRAVRGRAVQPGDRDGRPRVLRRPARARPGDRRAGRRRLEAQAERALRNLEAVLDAAGCTFADVVKTTCFLADINDFEAFNAVYARFIPDPPPARSTFQVAALPKGGAGRDRGHRRSGPGLRRARRLV